MFLIEIVFEVVIVDLERLFSFDIVFKGEPKYSDCEGISLIGKPKHIVLRGSHTKLKQAYRGSGESSNLWEA